MRKSNRTATRRLVSMLFVFPMLVSAEDFQVHSHRFSVPDGFEVTVAAEPPLVDRPIVIDFDEQGHMYVAESSGTNDNVKQQLKDRPHWISRLEDSDGDGRFDKRTIFADRMMFPEGTMWLDGSLYVSAPPSIWKLTDTDGDGVADQRQEWLTQTLTGCANDLHGPYRGPDGWIYWCKGAFAEQRYERPDRATLVTRAAHIFRCRPDGSRIEPVMTGGMDNPVDVVFTPDGQRIFTTTFLQHPGGGLRDGLIHAVYGGVYGKVHSVIEDHIRTGDVMPVLTHLGPAAPCGLARYESSAFGSDYKDNLFAALFNLQKVTRHQLTQSGSALLSRDSDFLVSDNPDFHPTDVKEDADGSLLVVNTGGWYKLCCPTSQLWKPDILGAIYRVRRTAANPPNDSRGLGLAWDDVDTVDLTARLGDARPAVRNRAIAALANRGPLAIGSLRDVLRHSSDASQRLNAVWALTRIEASAAREAVRGALLDQDQTIRIAAIHSAGLWRDAGALRQLIELLDSVSAYQRRCAAEAIGRIENKKAVPALLAATANPVDRPLEHALIYALIEIGDASGTRAGLASENSNTRRAAFIALDQMPDGGLSPSEVTPWLTSDDEVLRKTASWLVSRHDDWGPHLVGYFTERLGTDDLAERERAQIQEQLSGFAGDAAIQRILADALVRENATTLGRHLILAAMKQSGLKQIPAHWAKALEHCLRQGNPEVQEQAVSIARVFSTSISAHPDLCDQLDKLAYTPDAPLDVRVASLAATCDARPRLDDETFTFLTSLLNDQVASPTRIMAADVLTRTTLEDHQRLKLASALSEAGPFELGRLLEAFAKQSDEQLGLRLIESLGHSSGLTSLRVDQLRACFDSFPESVKSKGEELLSRLNIDVAQQRAYLDQLQSEMPEGDIRRGQAVFNGKKAACATCHAIGYLGGTLGPDLTKIGTVRTERDLLESLIYPSISLVRSYESTAIITEDGRQFSGILRSESDGEVILVKQPDEQIRIDRNQIELMRPDTVSIMPAGIEKLLSKQELSDLLAFLKATKWR